jgi:uncharacterized protein
MELFLNEITESTATENVVVPLAGEKFNHGAKLKCIDMEVEYYRAGETICIRIKGDFSIITVCDRCLADIEVTISADESFYVFPESNAPDIDYFYSGESIELDDFVHESIVMNIPEKILCSEDCKGVCSSCGTNLNDKKCNCMST